MARNYDLPGRRGKTMLFGQWLEQKEIRILINTLQMDAFEHVYGMLTGDASQEWAEHIAQVTSAGNLSL